MSVTEALGYANALLDTLQLKGFMVAAMIVLLSFMVYKRFFGGGSD